MSADREVPAARGATALEGPNESTATPGPSSSRTWLTSRTGWTDRTGRTPWAAILAAVAAMITLLCWALSSPPGSSPDDTFHMNSIWCGQGLSEEHCQGEPGDNVTRIVPHQVTTPQCFTGNGGASAGCRAQDYDDSMTPDASTEIGNWRGGGYPLVYYGFMNLFIQDTLDESITAMRSVNSALVVLLVGGLAWLLPRRLRFLAPVTFVITAVPLALFMFTSVNPSGWATLSAGVLWLAVYGAYEAVGWRQPAVLGVALVAAVMGSGARADAALFSVLGVGLALGLRLPVLRQQWRVTLAGLGILAVSAIFFFSSGHAAVTTEGFPGTGTPAFDGWTLLLANAIQVPYLWTSALGAGPMASLGWFDTPVPWAVGVASVAACAALVFTGWSSVWWQKIVALVIMLAALIGYPLILLQESGLYIGGGVQPRYLLPMMLMFVGMSLLPRAGHRITLSRFQVVALTVGLSVAQSVSLYLNLWRYIRGITSPVAPLANYDWWWESLFLTPFAVWVIGSLAFAGVTGYVLTLMARTADEPVPTGPTTTAPPGPTSPVVP
jgi:hypothetical protein